MWNIALVLDILSRPEFGWTPLRAYFGFVRNQFVGSGTHLALTALLQY